MFFFLPLMLVNKDYHNSSKHVPCSAGSLSLVDSQCLFRNKGTVLGWLGGGQSSHILACRFPKFFRLLMLRVIENFAKSLKIAQGHSRSLRVTRNDTAVEKGVCKSLLLFHCNLVPCMSEIQRDIGRELRFFHTSCIRRPR